MAFNLLKEYPQLLELAHLEERHRLEDLQRIFNRDIAENEDFNFRNKIIRPTKKEGEHPLNTLFRHLTTRVDKDEDGKNLTSRSFELHRSQRLHWIKFHIEEMKSENVEVFSFEDRIDRKDVIRTYIYDKVEEYVIILEPQRSKADYYLLTAYYLNEPGGKKQIKKKLKKRLEQVY